MEEESLVVRRDEDISNFKSKPFYTISANIKVEQGMFDATWKPSDVDNIYLDEESRLIDESHASKIKGELENKSGVITDLKIEHKKVSPPLPFALKDIQILAAKKYVYSPDKTLEIAQSLYDKYKLITYPRSDCQYLPEGQLNVVGAVFTSISGLNLSAGEIIKNTDQSLKSKAWNDKNVKAHHGIIPTQNEKSILPSQLSKDESIIYGLISTRYFIQFYPDHEYEQTTVNVLVNKQMLAAKGKTITVDGWELIEQSQTKNDDGTDNKLPKITNGEAASVSLATITLKNTTPPKPFTYDTLLSAMSGIARYVTNEKVKALLSEAQGIGTPATQGDIIKGLFDRELLKKVGKTINSTDVGRGFINILQTEATTPDMTAFWEAAMSKIENGEMDFDRFIENMTKQLKVLCDKAKNAGALTIPGVILHKCPAVECNGTLGTRKGKDGKFWGCSNYPTCKQTFPNYQNKPDFDGKSKK